MLELIAQKQQEMGPAVDLDWAFHDQQLRDLETLLEPATLGDPMRPLRWVSKSHDKLATALCEMGHAVSAASLPKLLEALGYRRHVNRTGADVRHLLTKNGGTVLFFDAVNPGLFSTWRGFSPTFAAPGPNSLSAVATTSGSRIVRTSALRALGSADHEIALA